MQILSTGQRTGIWQSQILASSVFSSESGVNWDSATGSDGVSGIEELFAEADTDGDGSLSVDELEEMLALMQPPPAMGRMIPSGPTTEGMGAPPDFESILTAEDSDGDDMISADESALNSEMFAAFDADGDGYISADEYNAMAPETPSTETSGISQGEAPPDFESVLTTEDSNGDGMISADESALNSEMFAAFDADGDGYISAEEYTDQGNGTPAASGSRLPEQLALTMYQRGLQAFFSGYGNAISTESLLGETII